MSENSIRFPDVSSRSAMSRRAWWLVGLNLVVPGSAQLLAGDRRLGRFGVRATAALVATLLATLIVYAVAKPFLIWLVANPIALTVIQVGCVAYAGLWIVLTLDTLRLARLVKLGSASRIGVPFLAVVVLVAAAGTAGYGAAVAGRARGVIGEVFTAGPSVAPVDGRYNILLLGGDAGPNRIGLRPDSISVVSIDAETGAAAIIGIPRNLEQARFSEGSPLYKDFPDGYDCGDECLISYLYTWGDEHPQSYPDAKAAGSSAGIEAMRDAAEGVTGLELQFYVLIDMQGFSDLIDALGGITITVDKPVPLGKNGDPAIGKIPAGEQRMNGETALWYARSRYNTTDYDRMARQRQVQEAIVAQFEPANVLTKFDAVASAGAQVVKTDIPRGMLAYFVTLAGKTRALPISTVDLIPANGVITAHPDYAKIDALVQGAIRDSTPTPTATPKP